MSQNILKKYNVHTVILKWKELQEYISKSEQNFLTFNTIIHIQKSTNYHESTQVL